MRDLVANMKPEDADRIYIIQDGCSSVPGFEQAGQDFVRDMKAIGVRFVSADKAFEI